MSDGMSDALKEQRAWDWARKEKRSEYYKALANSLRSAKAIVDSVFYELEDGDALNEAVTVSSDALRRAVLRANYLVEQAEEKEVASGSNAG